MSERYTEVDGWVAQWRLDHHHRIRMMLVRNVAEPQPLMSAALSVTAPDLAEMREQLPQLSRLWDAIRHQYWTEFLAPQQHSPDRTI